MDMFETLQENALRRVNAIDALEGMKCSVNVAQLVLSHATIIRTHRSFAPNNALLDVSVKRVT